MNKNMIRISKVNCQYEKEPLVASFGFKGNYINELWQTIVLMESDRGCSCIGLGVQSVLWSDPKIFSSFGEKKGNSIMYKITEFAIEKAKGLCFYTPIDLMDQLLPVVHDYGKAITGDTDLRKTFILNALTPIDHAAWLLYSMENGIKNFDDMIPEFVQSSLNWHHKKLAAIPLIAYDVDTQSVSDILDKGYFFLKIKIGSDPEKDGDLNKMLEWDKKRLKSIHSLARKYATPFTDNRKIVYYLDANGRYDSKDRLMKLLDFADKIGALEQIILFEEPFPEGNDIDVSDIPICLAVDESVHSEIDALECIERGYGAIALKPIAKTLSVSFKIVKAAYDRGIPCFCADLTVNPVMVDWNKNIASRLSPLPEMAIGVLESNGSQNYLNWETMKSYHPCHAKWTRVTDGTFDLDDDFYAYSGGSFNASEHYLSIVNAH